MSKEEKKNRFEESRALLVLGLLAVLATIRSATINIANFPLNPTIDTTILLMTLYAIFMIFAFSRDMIGGALARMFRSLALTVLSFSLIILATTGVIIGISYYQIRFLYTLGVIVTILVAVLFLKIWKARKRKILSTTIKIPLKEQVGVFICSSGFVLSTLMISTYSTESLLWVFFITSLASVFPLLYLSDKIAKRKGTEEKEYNEYDPV